MENSPVHMREEWVER